MTRGRVSIAVAAEIAVLSLSCARTPSRLNLVVVSVDTLRADVLSCYGNDSFSTPGFDRLAREGVLFEDAATVAPFTLPAHASLFTATTPLVHGVRDNAGFRLREDLPTLASILEGSGYRTGGFVASYVLDGSSGIGLGFDRYSDEMPETEAGLRERRGEAVLEEAKRFMGEGGDEPFFAFLHFFDPHRPYAAPEPFRRDPTDLKASYQGEVLYVDSLVRKLLEFLDSSELSDSTVVVVTADHGESLGDHGEDTHGFFLYQSTLRVPLLIRAPGLPAGKRVESLARIIDVAPSLLEILGVEAPSSFEGASLISAKGEIRDASADAYAETFVPRLHYGWSELRSLRRGSFKIIRAPRPELYDLSTDPREERNLLEERGDVALPLLEALDEKAREPSPKPQPLDERALASMRALGYLGPSAASPVTGDLPDPKDRLHLYKELLDLSVVTQPLPAHIDRVAQVLEQDPENVAALSMYGDFLLQLGRSREALAAYERLLKVQPESADAHSGLGKALLDLGERGKARTSLLRAQEIDPGKSINYVRLSTLARAEGHLDEAERWLREGMSRQPSRILHQELVEVLIATGREEELSRIGPSWEGQGAEAAAAYARGQLLASQGNAAAAVAELERALRLAPKDTNVEQALANALSRLGRFEEAMRHYESIVSRSPCYLGALTNVGAVYERASRVEEAIRSYERAIRCDASYIPAYRNLGGALARKGDLQKALDVLRRAKRFAPEDEELDLAMAELERMIR